MKRRSLARPFALPLLLIALAGCSSMGSTAPAASGPSFHAYADAQTSVWAVLERHGVFEQRLLGLADFEGGQRGSAAKDRRVEMSFGVWFDTADAQAKGALEELLNDLRALPEVSRLELGSTEKCPRGSIRRFTLSARVDPERGD
jgi:hypothetical protein